MLYIISEDNFFSIGVLSLLKTINVEAQCISQNTFFNINKEIKKYDIILLCAQSPENSLALASVARCTVGKAIFFIEDKNKHNVHENLRNGVISKKCNLQEFTSAVTYLHCTFDFTRQLLSSREVTIMNMFAKQLAACRIAKLLKLSEKTVSGHKHNALRKLGLDHLNARSVLLYERIFQARV